jgi:hypothetical protein
LLHVLDGLAKRVTSAPAVPATLMGGAGATGAAAGGGGGIGLTFGTGFAVAVTVTMIAAGGCWTGAGASPTGAMTGP